MQALQIPAYLTNSYQFSLNTTIKEVNPPRVLFSDTIFHPQGGGQPRDKGWVEAAGLKREILNATIDK
jgi:Ser-tRNA(Ala) deacylase AlaX